MAVLQELAQHPILVGSVSILLYAIGYIIYQQFFHPLAKYPGPFLASLTDAWQAWQFLTLKQPYHLTELHERYGEFVRYGPDKLSVTSQSAIPTIYQKGGKMMPKTEFYDAYGAAHPNVFGVRDEGFHSIRRRHMSHSFSISYVREMEVYLDLNIRILRDKIKLYCARNEVFDLKKLLHYYTIDVLGELAFSRSFGVQIADDESLVPPVVEHSLLAAVTGAWPSMTHTLKKWIPIVPSHRLRKLFEGRQACAELASRSVQRRLAEVVSEKGSEGRLGQERKDILTSLILAKDPDTGASLTQTDLETEAFGFIIAGTHTTSATTTLLFYHLLHTPSTLSKLMSEIDTNLPPLEPDQAAYSVAAVESSCSYLRNCMRENFRITPVFTMPLARRVMAPEGVNIGGEQIPQGTSIAVCNHAFHHNPTVWGANHNIWDPERWDEPSTATCAKLLMHFGLGGRQCLGKTMAMTSIYKLMSTLLREFEFELADKTERRDVDRGFYRGRLPQMVSVGISDLEEKLLVRAKLRTDSVFFRRDFPQHRILSLGLFATAEYHAFAAGVLTAAETIQQEDPHFLAIQKAIPSVHESYGPWPAIIVAGQSAHAVALAQIKQQLKGNNERMDYFLYGRFHLTFSHERSRLLPQDYEQTGQPCRCLCHCKRQPQQTPPSPRALNLQAPVLFYEEGPH